ncbi:hypothetical protein LR48_Vigan02g072400 [Vigna angularis]|uniref:Uncharacterized protein n=1 Tax=Phaseolus angularis TaxID=3914 RepID=A0A0L9TWM2_PHAAN|nr:hypothetical protein LR48_Vigan02g072400 [Vigna angularis]
MKQESDSRLPLFDGGDPPPPPSPPSRHENWKLARIRPSGSYTSDSTREISERIQIGQEGSPTPKKTHLSEDDPLGALDELTKIISDAPMNVHWDSTTFGREAQISLYLHQQDGRELASRREEINIRLIQLWMMYMFDVSNKKGFNDVYGFNDPSMTHERNKFDDIQTYITTYFGMGKDIYFFPYILGSLATHMMLSGRSTATATKLAWVALKGSLLLKIAKQLKVRKREVGKRKTQQCLRGIRVHLALETSVKSNFAMLALVEIETETERTHH